MTTKQEMTAQSDRDGQENNISSLQVIKPLKLRSQQLEETIFERLLRSLEAEQIWQQTPKAQAKLLF